MYIKFTKMQGTRNDFIIIDQFGQESFDLTTDQINFLCNRKFGIGADGLMILRDHSTTDFEMVYYNSDGNLSSMCGNGGRCMIKFAYDNRYIAEETKFMAPDGIHSGSIEGEMVSLGMSDVSDYASANEVFILDTGSPHYVTYVNELEELDVQLSGSDIRYSASYREKGINVNFVEMINKHSFKIRTYERGVEDETLSCGTGVTAAAISSSIKGGKKVTNWKIQTMGGTLHVDFEIANKVFTNIKLIGPAETVFEGKVNVDL